MATNRNYGTGRRKDAVARVYIMPGTGKVTINKRSLEDYFGLETLRMMVKSPLVLTQNEGKFDVLVKRSRRRHDRSGWCNPSWCCQSSLRYGC